MAVPIKEFLAGLSEVSATQILTKLKSPLIDRGIRQSVESISRNAKPWAVFDLDETLTYARPEKAGLLPSAFARGENPTVRSWKPWERNLRRDVAEPSMAGQMRGMQDTHNVAILTARSERSRSLTKKWLKQNNLTPNVLMMRPVSKDLENLSTGPYKARMLNRYLPTQTISHVYDDSSSVITAMGDMGIPATKITPTELPAAGKIYRQGPPRSIPTPRENPSSGRRRFRRQQTVGGFIDDPSRTNPLLGQRRSSARGNL